MKTERRHELQENELANWLGDKISGIRPYSKTILGVGLLALVAVMATSYITSRNAQAKQAGWSAYFDAMTVPDAESFEKVARTFPGTTAGAWALQTAADLRLDQALRQMFQNRETAQQELHAARQIYQQLVADATDPMLRQRATFGLAKCLESQGEFDEAVKTYEQVTSQWKDSQFASMAQKRVDELRQPTTREWYAWFDAQEPVQSPLNNPDLFQDLPDLPESPNLQMPEPGQLLGPSGTSTGSTDSGNSAVAGDDSGFQLDLGNASGSDQESGSVLSLDVDDDSAAEADGEIKKLELDLPIELDGADSSLDLGIPSTKEEPAVEIELDLPADESDSP